MVDRPTRPTVYRLLPSSLVLPRADIKLDKALALGERLQDEAIARKLEARKRWAKKTAPITHLLPDAG